MSNWSVFDNRRLDIGLRTLTNSLVTLRLRAATLQSSTIDSSSRAFSFQFIASAFRRCAKLLDAVEMGDAEDRLVSIVDQATTNDLTHHTIDDSFIEKTLLSAIENLLFVMHYVLSVSSFKEIELHIVDIGNSLDFANSLKFKPYSLIATAIKLIRMKVDSIKRM